MAANVETIFYTREKPWHGLGIMVRDSPSSVQALALAGLDWKVEQYPIITEGGIPLEGFWANVRDTDQKVLGVVSDKYKVAMTPIRVVCNNTLNLALEKAKRSWSTTHTGNLAGKMQDARQTLLYADNYMAELGKAFERLSRTKVSDRQVLDYINCLFPDEQGLTDQQKKNIVRMKEDLKRRYFDAPDLKDVGRNGYRFVNAVSDFATHAKPLRETKNYRENLFGRTMEGNTLIDRAYDMVCAA